MQRSVLVGVVFLAVLIVAQGVLAGGYQIDLTPVNNSIVSTESAAFRLVVTNFEKKAQRFQVYTLDSDWALRLDPMLYNVPPSSLGEYMLYARPRNTIGYGTHGITIFFKNIDNGDIIKRNIIVLVNDPNQLPGIYVPSVRLDVRMPAEINPREELKIGINLQNRNPLNIDDLTITLDSPLLHDAYSTPLPSSKEQYNDRVFRLDPYQASGDYPLTVTATYNNKTINEFKTQLKIAAITDVEESHEDTGAFFRSESKLILENRGNVPATYRAKLGTSILRRIFSAASPSATTLLIGGERYYVWDVTLQPQAIETFTVVENYRFLILLLILAIAGLASYYAFRSPLIAVKETIALKDEDEGSSNLKVRIFIKNRTRGTLDAVTAIDRIPSIATYVKRETLGLVSPTKVVTAEKKGTILKWELDLLEPYEERILSYSLTSKLRIVGKMRLPNAKVQFSARNGKERVTYTKGVTYEE